MVKNSLIKIKTKTEKRPTMTAAITPKTNIPEDSPYKSFKSSEDKLKFSFTNVKPIEEDPIPLISNNTIGSLPELHTFTRPWRNVIEESEKKNHNYQTISDFTNSFNVSGTGFYTSKESFYKIAGKEKGAKIRLNNKVISAR